MTSFEVGDLVWCKGDDFPYWPARIANKAVESELKEFRNAEGIAVLFFGSELTYDLVKPSQLIKFDPNTSHGNFYGSKSLKKDFKVAMEMIQKEKTINDPPLELNEEERSTKRTNFEEGGDSDSEETVVNEIGTKSVEPNTAIDNSESKEPVNPAKKVKLNSESKENLDNEKVEQVKEEKAKSEEKLQALDNLINSNEIPVQNSVEEKELTSTKTEVNKVEQVEPKEDVFVEKKEIEIASGPEKQPTTDAELKNIDEKLEAKANEDIAQLDVAETS